MLLLATPILAMAGPALAHQFVGYFDYGSAVLGPGAYVTAREVVDYVQKHEGSEKPVVGVYAHLDTAEAAEFSSDLAEQRAQAMAAELVTLGLDPATICTRAQGATQLARATPPLTREPLNRRLTVEINFGSPHRC